MGYTEGVPQVFRQEKYVVQIYTEDHEPMHVHVHFGGCELRVIFTEDSVSLDKAFGNPKAQDVRRALEIVGSRLADCLAKLKEVHG